MERPHTQLVDAARKPGKGQWGPQAHKPTVTVHSTRKLQLYGMNQDDCIYSAHASNDGRHLRGDVVRVDYSPLVRAEKGQRVGAMQLVDAFVLEMEADKCPGFLVQHATARKGQTLIISLLVGHPLEFATESGQRWFEHPFPTDDPHDDQLCAEQCKCRNQPPKVKTGSSDMIMVVPQTWVRVPTGGVLQPPPWAGHWCRPLGARVPTPRRPAQNGGRRSRVTHRRQSHGAHP